MCGERAHISRQYGVAAGWLVGWSHPARPKRPHILLCAVCTVLVPRGWWLSRPSSVHARTPRPIREGESERVLTQWGLGCHALVII